MRPPRRTNDRTARRADSGTGGGVSAIGFGCGGAAAPVWRLRLQGASGFRRGVVRAMDSATTAPQAQGSPPMPIDFDRIARSCRVRPGSHVRLRDFDPADTCVPEFAGLDSSSVKARAEAVLEANRAALTAAQELLWASDSYSVLALFQAMDAAGKDGTIKHVMSGVNPQGCSVHGFKRPSEAELDHNFLWRYAAHTPE